MSQARRQPTPDPQPHDRFADAADPLIAEVREARQWVEQQSGPDVRDHVEALREIQRNWSGPILSDRGGANRQVG